MTLIFADGFDANDSSLKWPTQGIGSSNTTRYGLGKSGSVVGSEVKKMVPAITQIYYGLALNMTGLAGGGLVLYGDAGTSAHISVFITNFRIALCAGRGGTVLAYTPMAFGPNVWYYIEIGATVAAAGGTAIVKVDGVTKINFTGNTKTSGTNNTTDVVSWGIWGPSLTTYLADDLYVCDSNGAVNNTFLGDIRIQMLMPTGTGSSTQFTPTGSVNNWQNVSDIPDVSTTYNTSAAIGQRDTYALSDTIANTGSVLAVQNNMHAFKTDSGIANLKPAILSGPTLAYDATQSMSSTNSWYSTVRETDPNTGLAWTVGGVNAMEVGAEVA